MLKWKKAARVSAFKVEVFDTTGAGDAFNVSFMLSYLKKRFFEKIAELANAVRPLTVSRRGKGAERFAKRYIVKKFLK